MITMRGIFIISHETCRIFPFYIFLIIIIVKIVKKVTENVLLQIDSKVFCFLKFKPNHSPKITTLVEAPV